MTATEEFRRMLDENGVSYESGGDWFTTWSSHGGTVYWEASEYRGYIEITGTHLTPTQAIEVTLGPRVTGETSDGYHTFNELYHHRAVLFSVIVRDHSALAWKAKKHHDGTMYDGMFIVGIDTPQGQATYHYDIDPYWEMFECRVLDRAPEWDGHTPAEAIARIATLGVGTCEVEGYDDGIDEGIDGNWYRYAPPMWMLSCGHTAEGDKVPSCCPTCGAKVVEE